MNQGGKEAAKGDAAQSPRRIQQHIKKRRAAPRRAELQQLVDARHRKNTAKGDDGKVAKAVGTQGGRGQETEQQELAKMGCFSYRLGGKWIFKANGIQHFVDPLQDGTAGGGGLCSALQRERPNDDTPRRRQRGQRPNEPTAHKNPLPSQKVLEFSAKLCYTMFVARLLS